MNGWCYESILKLVFLQTEHNLTKVIIQHTISTTGNLLAPYTNKSCQSCKLPNTDFKYQCSAVSLASTRSMLLFKTDHMYSICLHMDCHWMAPLLRNNESSITVCWLTLIGSSNSAQKFKNHKEPLSYKCGTPVMHVITGKQNRTMCLSLPSSSTERRKIGDALHNY